MTTHDKGALIDLGAASVETRGLPEQQTDLGFQGIPVGMSDED